MTTCAIRLDGVDLYYSAVAFKERSLKSLLARCVSGNRPQKEIGDIHALKSISVDINEGERVGLIGHNGAGKSSFLRVLADLYPIAGGKRDVRGTVRALFDLSLGFEPDASGRENILYRGLLLGLKPAVMRELEAEIVAFADLGEFIDYPIKTYSAGMQVRLAFAISTAVSADVLLLDEVLGAGDANFMVKAKQRIVDLINRSGIVVLASHDYRSLRTICERGVVLHHGELVYDGPIDQSIEHYEKINRLSA